MLLFESKMSSFRIKQLVKLFTCYQLSVVLSKQKLQHCAFDSNRKHRGESTLYDLERDNAILNYSLNMAGNIDISIGHSDYVEIDNRDCYWRCC